MSEEQAEFSAHKKTREVDKETAKKYSEYIRRNRKPHDHNDPLLDSIDRMDELTQKDYRLYRVIGALKGLGYALDEVDELGALECISFACIIELIQEDAIRLWHEMDIKEV